MNLPKIYIGPMTQNVIDAVIEFAEETKIPIGFILSRRQIDYTGGYVGYKTGEFLKYVRHKSENVIVCRDHSGPWQGQPVKSSDWSMESDIRSLYTDALNCMDVIHIDPWKKCQKNYESGLRETLFSIFYVNSVNPYALFEVGTEEAIRKFETEEFKTFLTDLKYNLGKIFDNIQYAVIQSGTSLLGTKNTGTFNLSRLKDMTSICKDFNILSKEHNGDYLTKAEIKIRFDNGLDAINIAPEFGVLETKILLDHIKDNELDFEKIYMICLNGRKWEKWVSKDFEPSKNKKELIEICGHYHNKAIKNIVNMKDEDIKIALKKSLNNLFDL